jgi:hypothetical protein
MVKRKKMMMGGQETPTLTKQEVLADPKIKEALKTWSIQQGGGAMRMKGSGWWDDFVGWLKRNKVISTASKIGSAIAGAVGFVPLSVALGAVSTGSSAYGYGRGMYSYKDAQAVARGIMRPKRMMGGQYAQSVAMPSVSSATPFLKF